jgi:hypothetical protein
VGKTPVWQLYAGLLDLCYHVVSGGFSSKYIP